MKRVVVSVGGNLAAVGCFERWVHGPLRQQTSARGPKFSLFLKLRFLESVEN